MTMDKKIHNILIIDDEASLVEMLKTRLEANGYNVSCAYDGQAALEAIQKEIPDLIILDIKMPKMDGLQLRTRLLEDDKTTAIPIIVMSGAIKGNGEDLIEKTSS